MLLTHNFSAQLTVLFGAIQFSGVLKVISDPFGQEPGLAPATAAPSRTIVPLQEAPLLKEKGFVTGQEAATAIKLYNMINLSLSVQERSDTVIIITRELILEFCKIKE